MRIQGVPVLPAALALLSPASFVVELPQGRLETEIQVRLSRALLRLGRWVRED